MLPLLPKVVATHTSGMCGGGHAPICLPWTRESQWIGWMACGLSYRPQRPCEGRRDWQRSSAFAEPISCSAEPVVTLKLYSSYSCRPFSRCHPCHLEQSSSSAVKEQWPKKRPCLFVSCFPGQPHATTLMCCLWMTRPDMCQRCICMYIKYHHAMTCNM